MNSDSELTFIKKNISNDLQNIDTRLIFPSDNINTLEELKKYLEAKLSELLYKNFDKVLNLLYRIDISEIKLQEVIKSDDNYKAKKIAELIIERQIEKIKTRRKYKSDSGKTLLK